MNKSPIRALHASKLNHKRCFGVRVTDKTYHLVDVTLWGLLIDSNVHYNSFSVIICTALWKQRWTENMSGGRLIAIAVDPSDYSEKAFDCEFLLS